jgi:hypothetical protein
MQRRIYFCKSWFRAKKTSTEIWSEAQALAAHENKQPYAVLVDSIEKPYCFIDVAKGFVGVGFLDELLREYLTYGFQEVEPNLLFLSMAVYREFDGSSEKIKNGTTYIFNRNGKVNIERRIYVPIRELETANSIVDVTQNYAIFPPFGEYDEFLRVER